MTNKTETKEQRAEGREFDREEKEKKHRIESQDILSNYLNNSNFISDNPVEQCEATKKAISFGLRLLPIKLDDTSEQEEVDKIRKDASKLLDKGIEGREISFTYSDQGGVRYPLYAIETQGEGSGGKVTFQAEAERLEVVEKAFVMQQYSKQLVKLQKVENEIGVALVKYDVIQRMTTKQLMEKILLTKFEKRYQKERKKR